MKPNYYRLLDSIDLGLLKVFVNNILSCDLDPLERIRESLSRGQTVEGYIHHSSKFLHSGEGYDAYYALCFKRNCLLYTFGEL